MGILILSLLFFGSFHFQGMALGLQYFILLICTRLFHTIVFRDFFFLILYPLKSHIEKVEKPFCFVIDLAMSKKLG